MCRKLIYLVSFVLVLMSAPVFGAAILAPGDFIIAIDADNNSSSPDAEQVPEVIDRIYGGGGAKYLNFGAANSGFIVTPALGSSVVGSFQIWTANDAEERDPATWALYGTNETIVSANHSTGTSENWTLIATGSITLPAGRNASDTGPGGFNASVTITNTASYRSYKMLFPTVKNPGTANSMQIAEIQFYGASEIATNPSPTNGSMLDADSVAFTWDPGLYAALHDVYVATSFSDVNTATTSSGAVYKGRQAELRYPPGAWDYMPVTRGSTYYWRIDEVNGVNVWRGDIWSFTVVPNLNWNPNPAHQATFVPVTTDLSWSKGNWAQKGHIIYLSTDFATVNNKVPGTMGGAGYLGFTNQPTLTTITIPGDLLYNTTYYWRADPIVSAPPPVAQKGLVWEFKTTVAGTGSILREIWQNITPQTAALSSLYNWPDFPENPTITDTITSFVSDPDWDDYGGRIHGWLFAPVSGDYRFYLTTDDNGELWLSTDDNPANAQLIAWESDSRGLYAWASTGEEASVPITLVGGKKYYIGALWKERAGGDHCAVGWTGPGISTITVIPGHLLMPFVQYWAYDPLPANQAAGVSATPTLDWLVGDYAVSHDVYFGTSYADVKAGTGGTFKGNQPLADHDYVPPAALEAAKIYYWKITEVNNAHIDKKWEGPVWTFRVAGGAGGLSGSYYHHTGTTSPAGFETFVLSRIDPEINFNWGDPGSPDPLVNVNQFSCRWQGQVEAPFSEDYIFYPAPTTVRVCGWMVN